MDDRDLSRVKAAAEDALDNLELKDEVVEDTATEFADDVREATPEELGHVVHENDAELQLSDEDERLPWLDSDDDYADEAVDSGRIAIFAIVGLMAVLALVALVWWFTRPTTDEALLAEGSTIEASDEALRSRPDDAGGTQVEGTGDVSFAVGEGEGSESQMGDGNNGSGAVEVSASEVAPSIDRNQTGNANGSNSGDSNSGNTVSAAAGTSVQVAAYSSRSRAEQGWGDLAGRYSALNGLNHRVVSAQVDGATVYRLQALTGSSSAAAQVCSGIKSQGGDCQVK